MHAPSIMISIITPCRAAGQKRRRQLHSSTCWHGRAKRYISSNITPAIAKSSPDANRQSIIQRVIAEAYVGSVIVMSFAHRVSFDGVRRGIRR